MAYFTDCLYAPSGLYVCTQWRINKSMITDVIGLTTAMSPDLRQNITTDNSQFWSQEITFVEKCRVH